MELDRTLLVFDYLNGEPRLAARRAASPDPIGPSAAAAAFDRAAFLAAGGFDERLFAYWEDVDLVLRLRRRGLPLRAGRRGARRPRALRHAGLGLGAKELPDGLRPRLRAAQVARADRRPVARGCCARDGDPLRGPGDRRPQRRRAARPPRRLSGRAPRPSPTRPSWSSRRRRAPARTCCGASSGAARLRSRPRGAPARPSSRAGRLSPRRHQRPLALTRGRARLARRRGRLDVVVPGSGNLEAALGPVARRHAGRLRGADGAVAAAAEG